MVGESTKKGQSLKSLSKIRPLYFLPADPLADEVLIPGFKVAQRVDCMVGFFSSQVLASLAPGLATYIALSKNPFRLVISPLLRAEDQLAIEEGLKGTEQVLENSLEKLFITEDLLETHTLKCLSWLLRMGRMEIKVAVLKDALFHPKVWLFDDNADTLAVHGSSNVTFAGIYKNVEQVAISQPWIDSNQKYVADKLRRQFDRLWEDKEDHCLVLSMPEVLRKKIIKNYKTDLPPTEEDLQTLFNRVEQMDTKSTFAQVDKLPKPPNFSIPEYLNYEEGPFAHQGQAVTAWVNNSYRGVLEMATGSGKTITSMIGAYKLYEHHKPLLIVVTAPYRPLIDQWCDEMTKFGVTPKNLSLAGNAKARASELQKLKRRFQTGLSDAEAVVVSHDTVCDGEFVKTLRSFNCKLLLVADEAHNLGRPQFIESPPEMFDYRLALSATPIRQYDQEGTDALFDFFGPVVFQFTLEEAIGKCLVEYDYFVHLVYLSQAEMDDWYELTGKIKQNVWRNNEGKSDEYFTKLLRDRRQLLETASAKIDTLKTLLERENLTDLKYTLIYASDKAPEQLETVNRVLNEKHVLFHQLTAEETRDRQKTKRIIRSFQDAEIQALTAKRVLDEGVNIPQISKAYILASTTVERQWVQRRGRLLRTCAAIDKTHSVIHDLLALPPGVEEGLDGDAKSLVRSELKRAMEFAHLARNAGRPGGPLDMLTKLIDTA